MKLLRTVLMILAAAWLAAAGVRADAARALKKLQHEGLQFTSHGFLAEVQFGHVKAVKLYLEAGMSPDATDERGWTALHRAAGNDDPEIVRALLEAKARVDPRTVDGDTPLCHAAEREQSANVALLLDAGADVHAECSFGKTPLHNAAGEGDAASVARLLAAGARTETRDSHGETALILAAHSGSLATVQALLAAGAEAGARSAGGNTALHEAVGGRNAEIVQTLLAAGADPDGKNAAGRSPLEEAQRFGTTQLVALLESAPPVPGAGAAEIPESPAEAAARLRELGIEYADEEELFKRLKARDVGAVKLLLAAGVKPSARNERGRPPLWEAIEDEELAMVEALIAGGADVDDPGEAIPRQFESGQTLVMLAVDRAEPALLAALLAAGASPDKVNDHGINGLASAARQGKTEHVRLLVDAGADVDAIDSAGTPVLYAALQSGKPEILRMLLDAGAQVAPHRDLLYGKASDPEMKAMLDAAAASPRASNKPPPVRPPAPPAPEFPTPVTVDLGGQPATAEQIYAALSIIARQWQPDAELVDLGTTSQGRLAPDGRSAHWVAHFYSRSAQEVNTMSVDGGRVIPSPHPSNEMRVFEVGPATILDTARLWQIAEAAGATVLTARGVRPMATLHKSPSLGVAWYFNYDDPDTGGVAMTIVIDAHSGVVVFTDP